MKNRNEQGIGVIGVILVSFCIFSIFIVFAIFYYLNIKPYTPKYAYSTKYYKDIFGNILQNDTSGCFGVCLLRTYKYTNIDKKSFEILYVASDLKYFQGELTETNYAKDKNNVYYNGKRLNLANVDSFRALNVSLAKDRSQYFYSGVELSKYLNDLNQQDFNFNSSIEVLAHKHMEYLVFQQNKEYFLYNDDDKTIKQIDATTALKYPKLFKID